MFLTITPIGLLAAALTGWFIAGIAVAPLERLGAVAKRLSPASISEKVEISSPDLEVARLENELEQARRRIEAGFTAQSRFMLNVSHELKTPIAVLLTEIQTVEPGESSHAVRVVLASAVEEMRRLGRMIDSFLLLTSVRERGEPARADLYAVNELVMDSVDQCRPMAAQHEVTLRPHLLHGDHLDAVVAGDHELLRTMLDNLVRNAVRFSPEPGRVDVEAATENSSVLLRVCDRGPGIPEDLLPRIFDRFAQATDERRRGRGHGLGLEIAQGIAELHGGAISVRNREAGGCEFTVRLPRAAHGDEAGGFAAS
jgi:signal transduction histidine kinase